MFNRVTPGITQANLSVDPLATEAESTPGDSEYNPFDDPDVGEDAMRELDLNGYSDRERAETGEFTLPWEDMRQPNNVGVDAMELELEPTVPDEAGMRWL